jgi:hypothetical protein
MRGKKGNSSHIDWVISLGIFIVYILLLLTWIKPSYQPAFEQDVLLNIIQRGIEKDNEVAVGKAYLKLDSCSGDGKSTFSLDLPGINIGNFKIVKVSDGSEVGYSGKATVQAVGTKEYWIINSANFNNYGSNSGPLTGLPDVSCTPIIGENILKKGLSGFTFPVFKPIDWGFPDTRDLKIIIDDLKGNIICYDKDGSKNCDDIEPDNNAVVYSREWRTNVITDNEGNFEPILINILVW